MENIYTDILDFHTVYVVLRSKINTRRIFYLIKAKDPITRILLYLIKRFGYTFVRIESYYENSSKSDFQRACLDFIVKKTSNYFSSQVDSIGDVSKNSKIRLKQFIRLASWRRLRFQLELIETVGHILNTQNRHLVLVQSTEYRKLVEHYSKGKEIEIQFYEAPFRMRTASREEFVMDTWYDPGSMLQCNAIALKLVGIFASRIILSCFLCLARIFRKRGERYEFDIIALVAQNYPSDGFNDLYWATNTTNHTSFNMLALSLRPMSSQALQFYSKLTPQIVPFKSIASFFVDNRDLVNLRFLRLYMENLIRWSIRVTWAFFTKGLSYYSTIRLLSLMDKVSFYKALMISTDARISWTSIEGDDLDSQAIAIASVMVDGLSLGSTWSLPYNPQILFSYNRNDVMFIWGKRQLDIITQSHPVLTRFIITGYPTSKFYKTETIPGVPSDKRIITFYDNICSNDVLISCRELREIYIDLITLVKRNPSYFLILKTKRDDYLKLGEELGDSIRDQIAKGNILVRNEYGDLGPGLISDVVVGISASSLAAMSAAYGRPCVLYDPEGVMDQGRWPLAMDHVIRIKAGSDLSKSIEMALDMEPVVSETSGGTVDQFVDDQGDERTGFYVACIVDSLKKKRTHTAAIESADSEYTMRWGKDTIYHHV